MAVEDTAVAVITKVATVVRPVIELISHSYVFHRWRWRRVPGRRRRVSAGIRWIQRWILK